MSGELFTISKGTDRNYYPFATSESDFGHMLFFLLSAEHHFIRNDRNLSLLSKKYVYLSSLILYCPKLNYFYTQFLIASETYLEKEIVQGI